jgi:hypothetical protein
MERRLTAILAADVAAHNDAGTLAALQAHRRELVDGKMAEHLSGKNPAPPKKSQLLSADKLPDQLQLRN